MMASNFAADRLPRNAKAKSASGEAFSDPELSVSPMATRFYLRRIGDVNAK